MPQDKYFIIFKAATLNMCLVSHVVPSGDDIVCLQCFNDETYVVAGKLIFIYHRVKVIDTLDFHQKSILGMCLIGSYLISYEEHVLYITDMSNRQLLHTLTLLQTSLIANIFHPATYLNKVLVVFENSQIELWNVIKQRLVYTFQAHINFISSGDHSISSIEQSPALHVIAMGFSSGLILLINLKTDQVLFHFQQETAVTSLTFRTDVLAEKFPYLASSNPEGVIHVWNLGDGSEDSPRRLQEKLEEAHRGYIASLHFLHGEPVLVSSSDDNSIKVETPCIDFR